MHKKSCVVKVSQVMLFGYFAFVLVPHAQAIPTKTEFPRTINTPAFMLHPLISSTSKSGEARIAGNETVGTSGISQVVYKFVGSRGPGTGLEYALKGLNG